MFMQHTEMGSDKDMGQDPLTGNVSKGMWISTYRAGLNKTLKCNVMEKKRHRLEYYFSLTGESTQSIQCWCLIQYPKSVSVLSPHL